MTDLKRRLFLSLVICVGMLANRSVLGAIPGATNLKAYTQHDFVRGDLDFNKRTLRQAYDAVGKKDPKWDAQADKFLDAMAIYFACGSAELAYQIEKPPANEQCLALADAATDAGCDDPLVMYCRAAILSAMGDDKAARPLVAKSVEGLIERKYPPYRIASAARRMLGMLHFFLDRAEVAKYEKFVWDYSATTMSAKADVRDLRYLVRGVWPTFIEDGPVARKLALCKVLEASKETDPWVLELFWGKYEIEAAWEARGGGSAASVTDDGWKAFYAHLAKARDRLVKAHKLHPEFPEAATEMISVAMGAGTELKETTRDWFDKAARAQFDHFPAYRSYVWSLYPRWGGSHREMFEFGLECLETGRYDTYVPYHLMKILEKIDADSGNTLGVFTAPQVKTALTRLMNETNEKMNVQAERDDLISYRVAIAYRTGQFREAADLVDKFGNRITNSHFALLGCSESYALSEIRALTSAHAAVLAMAEKDPDGNRALQTYGEIASKLAKDDPAQFYVQNRKRSLELKKEFMEGKWVSLKADEYFAPWEVMNGDWKKEKDGTLVATADQTGQALLFCPSVFGSSYEMEAKVIAGAPKSPKAWMLRFGPTREIQFGFFGIDFSRMMQTPVIIRDNDLLHVEVQNGRYRQLVNGMERMSSPFNQPEWLGDICIGIQTGSPSGIVKFEDVKIRRLDAAKPK